MKFNFKSFRLANFLSKRINTILLIVILIIILTGHVVCSCSKVSVNKVVEKFTERLTTQSKTGATTTAATGATTTAATGAATGAAAKVKNLIDTIKSDTIKPDTSKEAFTPANTNDGQSAPYLLSSMGGHSSINTNDWNQTDLTIVSGKFGNGVADILNRPKQPIPLPEGELDMFANTQFKPECCKNNSAYSLSTGCACMTTDQYNYLVTRGGNNVPYSDY